MAVVFFWSSATRDVLGRMSLAVWVMAAAGMSGKVEARLCIFFGFMYILLMWISLLCIIINIHHYYWLKFNVQISFYLVKSGNTKIILEQIGFLRILGLWPAGSVPVFIILCLLLVAGLVTEIMDVFSANKAASKSRQFHVVLHSIWITCVFHSLFFLILVFRSSLNFCFLLFSFFLLWLYVFSFLHSLFLSFVFSLFLVLFFDLSFFLPSSFLSFSFSFFLWTQWCLIGLPDVVMWLETVNWLMIWYIVLYYSFCCISCYIFFVYRILYNFPNLLTEGDDASIIEAALLVCLGNASAIENVTCEGQEKVRENIWFRSFLNFGVLCWSVVATMFFFLVLINLFILFVNFVNCYVCITLHALFVGKDFFICIHCETYQIGCKLCFFHFKSK